MQRGNNSLQVVNLSTNPVLSTANMAQAHVVLDACMATRPHSHPRASSVIHLYEGNNMTVTFLQQNGGEKVKNTLNKNSVSFVPQGYMHYVSNDSCEQVIFTESWNNFSPGTQDVMGSVFRFPREAVAGALNLDEDLNEAIQTLFERNEVDNEFLVNVKCLLRCGIDN